MKYRDDAGNKLLVKKSGQVVLKLKREHGRRRQIGQVAVIDKKVIFYKYVTEAMVKIKGVGFSEKAIEVTNPDFIMIGYEKDKIGKVSRKAFEKAKVYYHFKKQGFELQCFVPLSIFTFRRHNVSY